MVSNFSGTGEVVFSWGWTLVTINRKIKPENTIHTVNFIIQIVLPFIIVGIFKILQICAVCLVRLVSDAVLTIVYALKYFSVYIQ